MDSTDLWYESRMEEMGMGEAADDLWEREFQRERDRALDPGVTIYGTLGINTAMAYKFYLGDYPGNETRGMWIPKS